MNLEGMIAKKKNSKYHIGRRTSDWLKIKNVQIQEAIIAGFTEPKGSRQYFGSLLLAAKKKGKLVSSISSGAWQILNIRPNGERLNNISLPCILQ